MLAGDISTYLWAQLGLAGAALVVWLVDGAPVLRECLLAGLGLVRSGLGRSRCLEFESAESAVASPEHSVDGTRANRVTS